MKQKRQRVLYPVVFLQALLVTDLIIEAVVAFFIFVWLISLVFGRPVANGYEIDGVAAGLPLLLTVGYFFGMHAYLGGTLSEKFNRWIASRR